MTPLRRRGRGLVMRYGDKVAVDGLVADRRARLDHRRPRPQRRRQDHHARDLRGLPAAQQGSVRVLGLDPRRDREPAAPHRRDAAVRWRLERGAGRGDAAAHRARCTPTRSTPELVERLGLGECGRTPYRRLSGGQQQRLGLAMAIVGRPELVFVDEPTAGMDPQARRTTWELLEELRADGVTVVLTTHYMEEAERLADQVHIIDRGRLVASGSPLELTRGGAPRRSGSWSPSPSRPSAPESLRRALGAGIEVTPSTSTACWSPAPPTPPRWRRSRAGARRRTCCRSR